MVAMAPASKVVTILAKYQEKGGKKKEMKRRGVYLCNNGRGSSFVICFLIFNTLCNFQTLGIWPCLGSTPKESYMENKYKNIKIIR
jgi:hypothetical protein